MAKMSEGELQALVDAELEEARNFLEDELSPERAESTRYYLGMPFGNEEDNHSQMVSRDVKDTVNAILPSLMRIFFSSDDVVEFIPENREDVEAAEQAIQYINYIFQRENNGYGICHAVFKDALIRKCGVTKVTWVEEEKETVQRYTGQTEDQVALLMEDDESTMEINGMDTQMMMEPDEATGQLVEVPVPVFDITLKKTKLVKRIRIEAVPQDEFLMNRSAKSLEDATVVAHSRDATVSELVNMGYNRDDVLAAVGDEEFFSQEEELARRKNRQYEDYDLSSINEAMQKVRYVEAYIKVDINGDGVAELMKICTIGTDHKIVKKEQVDCVPFALFPCDPEPHLNPLLSNCVADDAKDIQKLKSQIWRSSLDSMAQSLNPRYVFNDALVEADDVEDNSIGAAIRAKDINAIRELVTTPVFQQAFQMLDYADNVLENRTGMSKASMGLDPSVLQSTTKQAVAATISASQGKIELIARNMAEGLKDLFVLVYKLVVKHQDREKIIRLRNKFIPIDPRSWNSEMDVQVVVGLGGGTQEEKFNILQGVAQKQEQILQTLGANNPIVSLNQYTNTMTKMLELAGFKDSQNYFNQLPADFQMPEQPPQPDPNTQAAELLAQVEREKMQLKNQTDQAKIQMDAQKEQYRIMVENQRLEMEREKFQSMKQVEQAKLQLEAERIRMEQQRAEAESLLKQLLLLKKEQDDGMREETQRESQANAQAQEEGLLAQAIAAVGQMMADATRTSAQAALVAQQTPKEVVRDEAGRIVGVRPVGGDQ